MKFFSERFEVGDVVIRCGFAPPAKWAELIGHVNIEGGAPDVLYAFFALPPNFCGNGNLVWVYVLVLLTVKELEDLRVLSKIKAV